MFVNSAIANLIREDKIPQIEQMISLNQQTGMITRKLSIENLLKRGLISKETADKYSYDVADNAILTGGNNSPQPGVPGIPQQTPQQLTAPMPQYSNLPQNSTNAYLNRR